jgi:hypothetical protein
LTLTKNSAGIEFANGQVIGYDLTAMLRSRVFRVFNANFMGPYVVFNAIFILMMAWAVTGTCYFFHKRGSYESGSPITGAIAGFDGYFTGFSGEKEATRVHT